MEAAKLSVLGLGYTPLITAENTLTLLKKETALLKSFRDDIEKSYSFHRVSRIRLKTRSLANRKT